VNSSTDYDANSTHGSSGSGSAGARPDEAVRISLRLKRFVEHPTTKLVVALLLIWSGFAEAYDTLVDDLVHFRLRAGHGVILLGVINLVSSLPAVVDGLEHWVKYQDARNPNEATKAEPEPPQKAAS
jgi:hypothetical protein